MAREMEEIVNGSIEDIGVDTVIEQQHEQKHTTPRWERWVVMTSSLLAVLSAIAALYATFAADKAAIAETEETVAAAYAAGAEANYNVLRTKIDILTVLGEAVDPADEAAMKAQARQIEQYREKTHEMKDVVEYDYETHDRLIVALTFFQMAILLGGIAVVVQRPGLWVFGMSFVVGGALFMGSGLIEFFTYG